MAYGKKYITKWIGGTQQNLYRAEILEKDYEGEVFTLEASENTCTIEWATSDANILNPIKSLKATLNILSSDTIGLISFYSDVDEFF